MTSPHATHWTLDPAVQYLNHGSFGACPKVVLEEQSRLRARMEAQPVRFLAHDLEPLLLEVRQLLGNLVGSDPDDLALVPNATSGVNTVLRSLDLGPGDELLVTDQEYNACRNALDHVARRRGATVVVASVPFPLDDPSRLVEEITAKVTDRTRLLLIDHVTSQTGMVLPLAEILTAMAERSVDTLVDGAHAPGMVSIDLQALDPAYYSANCHKWLCTPKGSAFLRVRKDRQEQIQPLSISHGANAPLAGASRFRRLFDWTGTDDPTPWLCIPAALEFLEGLLPGGLPELAERNRDLALKGRRHLCDALGIPPPCPDSLIGSLASVPLPDGADEPPKSPLYLDPLQEQLREGWNIEVPIMPWPSPPKRLLRISAQIYNHEEQYRMLASALRDLLEL